MELAEGVRAAMRRGRPSSAYLGTVTAINSSALSLTVDIGTGSPLSGVRWVGGYTPALSDFVVVLRVGSGWWVLGKNSKDLVGPGVRYGTATVRSHAALSGVNPRGTSQWFWFDDNMLTQGLSPTQEYHAGLYLISSFSEEVPSGATITSAKLRMTRSADDNYGSLHSPVLRLHSNTGSPGSFPATWITGEWRPGSLSQGQTGTWDLPSGWLTQLLAGTAKGVGIYSTKASDYSFWLAPVSVIISYTVPA